MCKHYEAGPQQEEHASSRKISLHAKSPVQDLAVVNML